MVDCTSLSEAGFPSQAFLQIDASVLAEGGDQLAGMGVKRVENVVRGEEETAIGVVFTFPNS